MARIFRRSAAAAPPMRTVSRSRPLTHSCARFIARAASLTQERPNTMWRVLSILPYLVPLMGSLAYGSELCAPSYSALFTSPISRVSASLFALS